MRSRREAVADAGHDVPVPFWPGRTDATQHDTDVDSFAVLGPTADGFRNYLRQGDRGFAFYGDLMRLTDRTDRWQREHSSVGFPVAVAFKFFDDQGSYLAALVTYYGFVSLFPLLLLLTSGLGFVLQGHAELQQSILRSAVSQFPVIGDQLRDPGSLRGSGPALAFGAGVALYGGLGVAQATQNAMNVACCGH